MSMVPSLSTHQSLAVAAALLFVCTAPRATADRLAAVPVAASEDRILPIRGAAMLDRLSHPIVKLKIVSVSPNGSHAIYLEQPRQNHLLPRLVLIDLPSGRQRHLPDSERSIKSLVPEPADRQILPLQWSHDGNQFALLEETEEALTVRIWSTKGKLSSRTVSLNERLGQHRRDALEVYNWQWVSDRDLFLLGVRPKPRPPTTSAHGVDRSLEASVRKVALPWFKSVAAEDYQQTVREGFSWLNSGIVMARYERELQLLAIYLGDGTAQGIPTDDPIYTAWGGDYWVRKNIWALSGDRQSVLFTGRDKKASSFGESTALGAIYRLDLNSRRVTKLYAGAPVSSFSEDRYDDRLIGTMVDSALQINISASNFGRLNIVAQRGLTTAIGSEPVILPSTLYPGARQGTVLRHQASAPEARLMEVRLDNGDETLISPPDYSVTSVNVSSDGGAIVAVLENSNTPPELFLMRRERGGWRRLTNYVGSSSDQLIGRIDKIQWRSKDNRFDIDGFLVKPSNYDPSKRYPLLVLLHGGPGSSFRNEFDLLVGNGGVPARVLASEGYLVLMPNLRGDRGYSVEFSHAIVGHAGADVELDLYAGIDSLIERGVVDADKLAIYGFSWGCRQLLYAISHSNRFKAAIKNDGGSFPWVQHPSAFYYSTSSGGGEGGYPGIVDYYGFDPIGNMTWIDIPKISTPLLMRWGLGNAQSQDGRVTFGFDFANVTQLGKLVETPLLYTSLRTRNVPIEIIVDNDTHGISDPQWRVEFQSRMLQWLDYFVLGQGENPLPAMKSPMSKPFQETENRK